MKIRKLEIKDAPLMLEWMHDEYMGTAISYVRCNTERASVIVSEKSISLEGKNSRDFEVVYEGFRV